MSHSERGRIVLIVSGSVAAFKAAALASKLTQAGFGVRTLLTESATRFIGSAQMEGLTRASVHTSTFAEGEAHVHLDLPKWAELTLVYPATANLLNRWAAGMADDLAGAYFLANRSPLWILPAMNPRMWEHPAVIRSVGQLSEWGARVLQPGTGNLACGDVGDGRLMEPEAVLAEVESFFQGKLTTGTDPSRRIPRGRVLVTAGGSREPIDSIRSITNTSTGETGVRIAEKLAQEGWKVTLLQSQPSREACRGTNLESIRFDTFSDFHVKFRDLLGAADISFLVHAAALSDFHVDPSSHASEGKISSEGEVALTLKPNPKLVRKAREYAKGGLKTLISFKLTAKDDLFSPESYPDSDVIIQNRSSEVLGEQHRTTVFVRNNTRWTQATSLTTKTELCQWISQTLMEHSA